MAPGSPVTPRASVWRADTPEAAARALLALYDLARGSTLDFTFAPTRLSLLLRHGLSVSGPGTPQADAVLGGIPGMAGTPA